MFSKKHIALFVSIVLGVSALAGCGAKDSADVTEAEGFVRHICCPDRKRNRTDRRSCCNY